MKNQALFSWKDKSKKIKMSPAFFLFGALRVNTQMIEILHKFHHLGPISRRS